MTSVVQWLWYPIIMRGRKDWDVFLCGSVNTSYTSLMKYIINTCRPDKCRADQLFAICNSAII